MVSTSSQRFAVRGGCLLAVTLGLAVLAGAAQRFGPRALEPGARWIWAAGDYSGGEPIAFYAVRELELADACPARVAITADEAYLLYVNGRPAGTGGYLPEAPLDEYQVGDLLQPGVNRILVEARSSRGAGGLLAEIGLGPECTRLAGAPPAPREETRRIVTDGSWRIFRRYDPGLFGGWATRQTGDAPTVWGAPPTGRWRLGTARRLRPIPFQGYLPPDRLKPLRHRSAHERSWRELDASRRAIPALGPQQVFDWGREVTGFVSFDLRFGDGEPGLLFASTEPPDATRQPPDAVIIPVPGRRFWQDARPRRFRYLLLVGVEPASRIEVDLLDSGTPWPEDDAPPEDGIFGFQPPRAYSRTEEQVWKRLEEEAASRKRPAEARIQG